jgi:hypothetical protein
MRGATAVEVEGSQGWPVDVRTRFERFPASIKGAFVMQGADGNPHRVRLMSAWIARIPSGGRLPVPVEGQMVDVAPSRDLFVPFEAASSELAPSWYAIESSVQVDGGRSYEFTSRPFVIPWSKGEVRCGTTRLDRRVRLGERSFVLDRIELGPDSASVVWRVEGSPGDPAAEAAIVADGTHLDVLPPSVASLRAEFRTAAEERRTISYPVMRAVRNLAVQLKVGARQQSELVKVPST